MLSRKNVHQASSAYINSKQRNHFDFQIIFFVSHFKMIVKHAYSELSIWSQSYPTLSCEDGTGHSIEPQTAAHRHSSNRTNWLILSWVHCDSINSEHKKECQNFIRYIWSVFYIILWKRFEIFVVVVLNIPENKWRWRWPRLRRSAGSKWASMLISKGVMVRFY